MNATKGPISRRSLMVVTTRWRGSLAGLALTLVFLMGLACSPADTALPLSSAETTDSLGSSSAEAAPFAASSGPGSDDTSGLGAFPVFLPPVAVGTDTQECQLGTDPYSTCI